MAATLRTIVESHDATVTIDDLRERFPRFNDWWEDGWKWRLARDPFRDSVRRTGKIATFYLLRTSGNHASVGIPFSLTFLYAVTDDVVELLHVRVTDIRA